MRGVAGLMAFMGSGVCVLGVTVVDRSNSSKAAIVGAASAYLAIGLALVLAPPRRWLLEASVFGSIVVLSVLIAFSDPIGMAPIFFMWPVAFGAYFMAPRRLLLVFLLAAAGTVAAVAVNRHPGDVDTVIGVVSSVGIVAWLMDRMNRRERALRMQLEVNAGTDPLTGLLNRRAFLEALAHCEAAAEHWLLYVDLDGFKAVNDQLGHEAGDRVLIDVAAVLRSSGVDVAARLGGDEFCLLLHGNEFRARQIAERIVQRVAAMVTGGPASPRIGASIGVARTNGNNIEAALRNADAACYRAKRGGKSQFALAVERSG